MLPDDVREAVEAADNACSIYKLGFEGRKHWQAIKAHLLAREAEVERIRRNLQAYVDNGWTLPAPMIRDLLNGQDVHITAHLSETTHDRA